MLIFPCFIKRNEPVINLLLLIIKMIFSLDVSEEVLESTNHVSVKSNSYHFDQNLIQVLNGSVTFNITIANRCERSNDPVD